MVLNDKNEPVPTRPVTGWRVCMDYRKLNSWTEKHHFPMPFMDQMLDRLAGKGWYYFLDGYSGYNQIFIAPLLLVQMGPLRSEECRLGCAMHPPHFRDI